MRLSAAEVKKVEENHKLRFDVIDMAPLVPRPFKRRPRPRTAIIARAAAKLIENKG